MLPLLGEPMIVRQVERLRRAQLLDRLVVLTSTDASDDDLAALLAGRGIDVFRGPLDDVLGRFVAAVAEYRPSTIVRLTGDCPLADPDVVDLVIGCHVSSGADYTSNVQTPTFPDGLDVECVQPAVLVGLHARELTEAERQHVTYGVYQRPEEFRLESVVGERDLSGLRWTVDSPDDYAFVSRVYEALYPTKPDFRTDDILIWLADNPEQSRTDSHEGRNEGLQKDLGK
jgi:spore coat polysaccharide biosynthesis protein SpsF